MDVVYAFVAMRMDVENIMQAAAAACISNFFDAIMMSYAVGGMCLLAFLEFLRGLLGACLRGFNTTEKPTLIYNEKLR